MAEVRDTYPKVELPADIRRLTATCDDSSKVKRWKYKISSINCSNFPTVYARNLNDAYGYYDLYIGYASQCDWSMGVRFRLETRKGKVVDEGGFVPPHIAELVENYAKNLR